MAQETKAFNFYFDSRGVKYSEKQHKLYLAVLLKYDKKDEDITSLTYATTFAASDEEAEKKLLEFEFEDEDCAYIVKGVKRVSDIINESKVID